MTIPCKPYHLFCDPVPDGLTLYPFGRHRIGFDEDWLQDETVLDRIDQFHKPTVYLDMRWFRCVSGWQIGRIVQLGHRTFLREGNLVVCNLSQDLMELFQILRLDRLPWFRMTQENLPYGKGCLPDPTWLTWDRGVVTALARTIREEQDFASLPILGDALEEAGCKSQDLLAHLHEPGRHYPDCFALKLLLGQ